MPGRDDDQRLNTREPFTKSMANVALAVGRAVIAHEAGEIETALAHLADASLKIATAQAGLVTASLGAEPSNVVSFAAAVPRTSGKSI